MEGNEDLKIFRLSDDQIPLAVGLMEKVFTLEQYIPESYLPVNLFPQMNWGVFHGERLIALAIAWWENEIWHWGRFAVDPEWRGKGIGKKLIQISLKELFDAGAKEVHIDARDITVNLLSKLGARVIGNTFDFYGNVTPMRLSIHDFKT
ncbi:GNAT family N-acetyltransferase [Cecembia calidifontis]|jgi:GNAT superfamily N-acetyltransferase|uniref:Acetyltransferase (GNAT) family protein n=1 Tax=Cecembia calidifontis TaxID=1187080 RepID=A0A4Q7PC03_9BACT|nr:GNAT family N-acetyltransferase [Cecembia calidifontis]RZS97228.1 acetyltransferase (GNAT) family protein [Cecembia calidifontis]